MKRLFMITLAIVWLGVNQEIYAEIRNGYEEKLKLAHKSLKIIDSLFQIAQMKEKSKEWEESIRSVQKRRNEILKAEKEIYRKYMLTQHLLKKFKAISPQLYDEINGICDLEGNVTHVYVKVVDKNEFGIDGIMATTNLAHSEGNFHVYHSEYGNRSVSVKIRDSKECTQLLYLAHEFGHVKYQVPNLFSYVEFYSKNYLEGVCKTPEIGHLWNDPSHRSVVETLKEFSASKNQYKKEMRKAVKNDGTELVMIPRKDQK